MVDATISDLLQAVEGFTIPLRSGAGFEEGAFQRLCLVLESLARQWKQSDSIPKEAANVLLDLWPGIQNCSYLYGEEDAKRIMKAADTVGDLSRNIVRV